MIERITGKGEDRMERQMDIAVVVLARQETSRQKKIYCPTSVAPRVTAVGGTQARAASK